MMTQILQFIPSLFAAGGTDAAPQRVKGDDFWLPPPSSTFGPGYDHMFTFINWLCYFFFILIAVFMVIFVVKYRMKKGHTFRSDGPSHHLPLELTWSIIPLFLVIAIFWLGFAGSTALGVEGYVGMVTPRGTGYEISVTAQKWQWSFKYPNGVISDDLYIPAGEPVTLKIHSLDVLHSLYIPDFRVKRDCVPGRIGFIWFQVDEPTGMSQFHHLFCAEFCGTNHSNMNRRVFVLPRADFDAWLAKEANYIDTIPEEELYFRAGPKIYARCQTCHALDGTVRVGPSWKGIFERIKDGSGKFTDGRSYSDIIGPGKEFANADEYIRDSILNPANHVVMNFSPSGMTTFKGQLNDKQIEAITGFMQHLNEFDPVTGKDLKEKDRSPLVPLPKPAATDKPGATEKKP